MVKLYFLLLVDSYTLGDEIAINFSRSFLKKKKKLIYEQRY